MNNAVLNDFSGRSGWAAWSEILERLNGEFMCSNPAEGMDVCLRLSVLFKAYYQMINWFKMSGSNCKPKQVQKT
jgi:hypothetical protein